jgi:hypothetical protein
MANERRRCISLQTRPCTIVFGSGRGRERWDAKQLVSMTSTQLLSQRTLALLDDLETAARFAYIGQIDPSTNIAQGGTIQIHSNIQHLATYLALA